MNWSINIFWTTIFVPVPTNALSSHLYLQKWIMIPRATTVFWELFCYQKYNMFGLIKVPTMAYRPITAVSMGSGGSVLFCDITMTKVIQIVVYIHNIIIVHSALPVSVWSLSAAKILLRHTWYRRPSSWLSLDIFGKFPSRILLILTFFSPFFSNVLCLQENC